MRVKNKDGVIECRIWLSLWREGSDRIFQGFLKIKKFHGNSNQKFHKVPQNFMKFQFQKNSLHQNYCTLNNFFMIDISPY